MALQQEGAVLLDCRNLYESKVGTFVVARKGAVARAAMGGAEIEAAEVAAEDAAEVAAEPLGTDTFAQSWDVLRNDDNNGYDSQWFTSGYVHQKIVGPFSAYAEATVRLSSASFSTFAGGLGAGVTWDFSKSLQFDYGVSRGLGNRATDWENTLRVRWEF
jgi:hypothetical protein